METIWVGNEIRRDYTIQRSRARDNVIDPAPISKPFHFWESGPLTLLRCLCLPVGPEASAQIAPMTGAKVRVAEIPLLVTEPATAAKSHAFDFFVLDSDSALVWCIELKTGFERENQPRRLEVVARSPNMFSSSLSVAATMRTDRIAAIQGAWGFPTQALAEILRVSRPCLYKWLDPRNSIQLHPTNRERLDLVHRLANEWTSRSRAPLSSLAHERLADGRTMTELLSAGSVDTRAVLAAYDELIGKLQSRPKTIEERMSEAGFKRRPTHRSLPEDE